MVPTSLPRTPRLLGRLGESTNTRAQFLLRRKARPPVNWPTQTIEVETVGNSYALYRQLASQAYPLGPIQNAYPKIGSLQLDFFNIESAERWFSYINDKHLVSNSDSPDEDESRAVSVHYRTSKPTSPVNVIALWKGYSRSLYFVPHQKTIEIQAVWECFRQFGRLMSVAEKQAARIGGKLFPAYKVTFCSLYSGLLATAQWKNSALKGQIFPFYPTLTRKMFDDYSPYIRSLSIGDYSSRSLTLSHFDPSYFRERQVLYEATQKYTIESCVATGHKMRLVFGSSQEKEEFVRGFRDHGLSTGKVTIGDDLSHASCRTLKHHKRLAIALGVSRHICIRGLPRSFRLKQFPDHGGVQVEAAATIEMDMWRYGMVMDVQIIGNDAYVRFMDIDSAVSAILALRGAQLSDDSELSEYKYIKAVNFMASKNVELNESKPLNSCQ